MSQFIEATVDQGGLVRIPEAVLAELEFKPGSKLYFELDDDGKVMLHKVPVRPQGEPEIVEEDGMLILHGVTVADANDLVRADREARMQELMRGLY